MEGIKSFDRLVKTDRTSTFSLGSNRQTLMMYCEQLLSMISNRTPSSNVPSQIPLYIRQLLAKHNLTLHLPKTIPECVLELSRLMNATNDYDVAYRRSQQSFGIQEHSRSLIVFVFLIAFVSAISVIGNLCLAKVIYSKRLRLSQTDRIVLCLALSELCLVLIDSPIEIYRFLSISFSKTWLCRFHTFFESLFSSCIIFYHLLGAFDRYIYIHGHALSKESRASKCWRRISTKSGSILLLIVPIIFSIPIAACNALHAHVVLTSITVKACVVQYTYNILISVLIFLNVLPLLFAFFLHSNLIYFIRKKHQQNYVRKSSDSSSFLKHNLNSTFTSQFTEPKRRREKNHNDYASNPQVRHSNLMNMKTLNRHTDVNNTDKIVKATTCQRERKTNASTSSSSSRSSNRASSPPTTSSTIHYAQNTRANANAKRTVVLLVLLLTFYVLCWIPYNIYTWHHAYRLTARNQNILFTNRTTSYDYNQTINTSVFSLHADLRRFIFLSYSLYLLSMISMCFSFIFYFSLNKQARHSFAQMFSCIHLQLNFIKRNENERQQFRRQDREVRRYSQQQMQAGNYYKQFSPMMQTPKRRNEKQRTVKYNTHPIVMPSVQNVKQNNSKRKLFAVVIQT